MGHVLGDPGRGTPGVLAALKARDDAIAQMKDLLKRAPLDALDRNLYDHLRDLVEHHTSRIEAARGVARAVAPAQELTIEHNLDGTIVKLDGKVIAAGAIPQKALDDLIAQYRRPLGSGLTISGLSSMPPPQPQPDPPAERERTFGVEPLLGWRVWAVKTFEHLDGRVEPRLAPVSDFLLWHPRQRITAVCTKGSGSIGGRLDEHEAPHPDCNCGLWAVDRVTAERMYGERQRVAGLGAPTVFGQVAMWGRVLEFEHGYRAQYAYPTLLYGYTDHPIVRELGDIYGVPVRILAGPTGPPDPGETITLAAGLPGQHAIAALKRVGMSATEFSASIQKASDAIAATIGPMTVSANEMRKLLRLPELPEKEPSLDTLDTLAAHAAAGSRVVDVYTRAENARYWVDQFVRRLDAACTKHRRVHRWRVLFPSGGSYEAVGAVDEDALMRHQRGRRVDVIDLPPGFSPDIRGYLNATGATIL